MRIQRKRCPFIAILLIALLSLIPKSHASAQNDYPWVSFDPSREWQVSDDIMGFYHEQSAVIGETVSMVMVWHYQSRGGYEGYDLAIHAPDGKVVFTKSEEFYTYTAGEHFYINWYTKGMKKGTYRAVFTKRYYSYGRWIKAPSTSSIYITLTPHPGDYWGSWFTVKEPTCKESGLEERDCYYCGEKQSRIIPKTNNHIYSYDTVDRRASTTQRGIISDVCSVCGHHALSYTYSPQKRIKVHVKTKVIKAKRIKNKTLKFKPFKTTNGYGETTYRVVGGNAKSKKALKLNKKGLITIKKGTKKGTYKIKVRVKKGGDEFYKPQSAIVSLKVKVK